MNVKDNRSFWVYLLLSIVTCGLYSIYFWYVYVEDLNTIFYGDGEDSPNYIIVLLLSWVTCGIYGVYWRYKQANRMYRESYDRYGVMIEENGSAILLWTLLGYLTGGIGQLLLDFLDHKPEKLEVILTGQGPSEALIERADYVSELKKIKHPFDKGLAARDGIER